MVWTVEKQGSWLVRPFAEYTLPTLLLWNVGNQISCSTAIHLNYLLGRKVYVDM
jgi:hypothetical protein